jgi:hypothetical protein
MCISSKFPGIAVDSPVLRILLHCGLGSRDILVFHWTGVRFHQVDSCPAWWKGGADSCSFGLFSTASKSVEGWRSLPVSSPRAGAAGLCLTWPQTRSMAGLIVAVTMTGAVGRPGVSIACPLGNNFSPEAHNDLLSAFCWTRVAGRVTSAVLGAILEA